MRPMPIQPIFLFSAMPSLLSGALRAALWYHSTRSFCIQLVQLSCCANTIAGRTTDA